MDSTSGRYALAANFVSQDEAVQTYLADHPTGFHLPTSPKRGAPHIDRRTRWRTACAAWTASMGDGQAGALLEDGNHAELALRLVRVAASAAAVPGMIEVEVLQEAFEPGDEVRHFLDALFGYLSVPSPARARFDKLSAASNALGIPPEAAWPMVTFFPFVAMPSRHVLLLPRSACAGASDLDRLRAPARSLHAAPREAPAERRAGPRGRRELPARHRKSATGHRGETRHGRSGRRNHEGRARRAAEDPMNDDFRELKERIRRLDVILVERGLSNADFAQALSKVRRATRRGDRTREPTRELRSMLEHAELLARSIA
jgi:hypothetical protein